MNTLPKKDPAVGQVTHNQSKSRLPLNRLAEAKVLNSNLGHHLKAALFPDEKKIV
jgi:hypothetical protein